MTSRGSCGRVARARIRWAPANSKAWLRSAHHRGQLGHERRWVTRPGRASTEVTATRREITRPGICRPRPRPGDTTWGTAPTRQRAGTARPSACHRRWPRGTPARRGPRRRPTPARCRSCRPPLHPVRLRGRAKAARRTGPAGAPLLADHRRADRVRTRPVRRRPVVRRTGLGHLAYRPGSAPASTGRARVSLFPSRPTTGPGQGRVLRTRGRDTTSGTRTTTTTTTTTTSPTTASALESPGPCGGSQRRRRGATAPPR